MLRQHDKAFTAQKKPTFCGLAGPRLVNSRYFRKVQKSQTRDFEQNNFCY